MAFTMVKIESEILTQAKIISEREGITVEEFVAEAIPRYMNWVQELNEKGYVKNPDGSTDVLISKECMKMLSERAEQEGISVVNLGDDLLSRIIDEGIERSLN